MTVLDPLASFPPECLHGVVTIGHFDGAHLGHAALLRAARALSERLGGGAPVVAVTFEPHARAVLRPDLPAPAPLTPLTDRLQALRAIGADHAVAIAPTRELLGLSSGEFFNRVLVAGLAARGIVEGPDFCFGKNRSGTMATLCQLCRAGGIELVEVNPVILDGEPVSSTRIRAALESGDVTAAARFLGRPYRLRGSVVQGDRRGRTLGFPTANLECSTLVPAPGVYAACAILPDGFNLPSAVHVGPLPTFGVPGLRVEAHLIGFQGDIYGQPLALEFLSRLRDPARFPNREALVDQLRLDVERARAAWEANHG
ncbi:MAG: riboflavin biosynthesis protein RibF [Planctomycetes bacterium]|nr:riboflavin biosynthesis protein RibF [Planctomycetota bacterium]